MKSLIWWLLGTCVLGTALGSQNDKAKRFSVAMSIEMTTFSDPYTRDPIATCKRSLDGKYFAVVTTKGSLASNTLESRVFVYSSQAIQKYLHTEGANRPAPRQILFRAETPQAPQFNSYGSLITEVQWATDSQSLLALVEMPHGVRHLFRLCVKCRTEAVDLTPGDSADVQAFSESSGTIAYLIDRRLAEKQHPYVGDAINARASVITGATLLHVLDPDEFPDQGDLGPRYELWVDRKGQKWRAIGEEGRYFPVGAMGVHLAFSSDGKHLVAAQAVREIPDAWSKYRGYLTTFNPQTESFRHMDRSGRARLWPWQYTIIDIEKRTSRPLVDAPSTFLSNAGNAFEAVWSQDQTRILFTGSYLPLDTSLPTANTASADPCAVAIYDVDQRRASCVVPSHFPKEYLRDAEFGISNREIRVHWLRDGNIHTTLYQESNSTWTPLDDMADTERQQGLTLRLHQSLDSPPELWASDDQTRVSKPVWNPNPQLNAVTFGRARVYRWTDNNGYTWRGGLVFPPDYVEGRRYPLVIQTHGFYNENEFLSDGSFTTGFAAQPLAAAGMIVLQMEDRGDRYSFPPTEEARLEVAGFRSAIDRLNTDGLTDPTRVGIIGFSRAAWYVENALIDCPRCFKAATLIDGVDQSYVSDILFAANAPSSALEHEAANGGKPFGSGLKEWMQHATGFNLGKVQTPVQIQAIGRLSVLGEWEIYSQLSQQGKAVDLIYIPNGQHILQAPLDRYASQQGSVDWFRFWLMGAEAPSYANTAARWAEFRKLCQ